MIHQVKNFAAATLAIAIAAGSAPADVTQPILPDLNDAEPQVAQTIRTAHATVIANLNSPTTWGRYGMVLAAHKAPAARSAYEQAVELDPDSFQWTYLLGLDVVTTDPVRGAALLERAAELDDTHAPLYLRLAVARGQLGDRAAACREAERALGLEPDSAYAMAYVGRCRLDEGSAAAAEPLLRRAVEIDPVCRPALAGLAEALRSQGDLEGATVFARRAAAAPRIDLIPDRMLGEVELLGMSSPAILGRATAMRQAGLIDQADRLVESLVSLNPRSLGAAIAMAHRHLQLGRFEAGLAEYQRARKLDPNDLRVQLGLGDALMALQRLEEAAQAYQAAGAIDPTSARALRGLGLCLARAGRANEAAALLRRSLRVDPSHVLTRAALGRVLSMAGDHGGAIMVLRPLITMQDMPDEGLRSEAITWSGISYLALGGPDNASLAADLLLLAVERLPDRRELREPLITALVGAGRWAEAAQRSEPWSADVIADPITSLVLSRILSTSPDEAIRDPDRALALVRAATKIIGRDDPDVLDTLACALAATGRYELAVMEEDRAIEIARSLGREDQVTELEARRALFERRRPFVSETMPGG